MIQRQRRRLNDRRLVLARLSGKEERAELDRLDAALFRIDLGTYGYCVTCGDPIGRARLEAMPEVDTCVECARWS